MNRHTDSSPPLIRVELHPVRARLAENAAEWRWSSASAHLQGQDDSLAKVSPLLAMVGDWQGLLDSAAPEEQMKDQVQTCGT